MARPTNPSLQDIADAAGVSKMTVSRVLRGGKGFSDETEIRVRREAERLGYLPNKLAAAFGPRGSSTLIGVCVPRLNSSLFGVLLETLNATLGRFGYQTMIGVHDERPTEEETWLRTLAAWKPAGVILVGHDHSGGTRGILRDMGVPVAEIWDLTTAPIDLAVGFSHGDAGQEMARCVAGAGHARVGYVGALADRRSMGQNRLDGFRRGLDEFGLELFGCEILEDRPGFYQGYYGTETLFGRVRDLDAVYYHNDEMAIGGMAWFERQGMRVPEEVAVAGFGGMEAASILRRRLTTTAVPAVRIARLSAEVLVQRLRGEPVEDVSLIPTVLVRGATV
ncbi:MAG: LacI family DNA-binding transcriptional regulator [Pseudomonadota bacterium]